jgi:transposase-like protein
MSYEISNCPFCGSDENLRPIGKTKDGKVVYKCEDCNVYFSIEVLKPPFEIVIEE